MPVNYEELTTGKYYEELEPGNVYKHSITRTVSEADNLFFSALTYNSAWLHTDEEYSKTTMWGTRIVNSMFTLALVCGVGVNDVTLGTTLGNLGFTEIKFPNPVFIGDTIHVETEVIGRRESKSRPDTGIVEFETRGYNQRDEVVVTLRRTGLMLKRSSRSDAS
ncbi:MaoC family dehydratase [Sneathiella chungangensis]|uniref:MaoC family dehydratase n=1 Tax=Sneathiella chungangensis TaxID=1418234 RepID=A0A845MHB6_9PROT|nr:MaoC family dehydratase [Sneathiella chungangensis]MZR22810.1 MaoC family dehydratase [Sneathiella chungangensis]